MILSSTVSTPWNAYRQRPYRRAGSQLLPTTIDLIRSFDNFEVLILTDDQLQQALPLGASWIEKRSPRNQAASLEQAWAFLPYVHNGKTMAMNVIVVDKRAVEAISNRIDVLWEAGAKEEPKGYPPGSTRRTKTSSTEY